MSKYIPVELLRKFLSGNCTPEETVALTDWFNSFDRIPEEMAGLSEEEKKIIEERLFDNVLAGIAQAEQPAPAEIAVKRIGGYRWAAVAASLLLTAITATYFLKRQPQPLQAVKTGIHQTQFKNDVLPGSNRAQLTLGNGSVIDLNNSKNGLLSREGETLVKKTTEGQVTYHAAGQQAAVQYNMIHTPRGGQYSVVLADGTKVWLNAASSLRFPTAFTGKQREVELSGEAYFEVAKNPAMPFVLKVNGVKVEVLGTHFNIKAYEDDGNVKATLLEGSVKVRNDLGEKLITPGQQAVLNGSTKNISVHSVNTDDVIAWQKGYYVFKHESIKSIMRDLSRWYDVDVSYSPGLADKSMTGKISRYKNLSELLDFLELTDEVHFKMEGKGVQVMP